MKLGAKEVGAVCSDLHLLRLHVEAVWGLEIPPLRAGDNEVPTGDTPWALYLARVDEGEIRLWRDVESSARAGLVRRAHGVLADVAAMRLLGDGVHGELVFRRDPSLAVGPVAVVPRLLGEADRALIDAFEPGEVEYWLDPRRGPLFGVVESGRLLSVAHSSRRTAAACELGVNTLAEARRRGGARACVLAWGCAVAAEGLEPMYSASSANVASHALARACGYRRYAYVAQIALTARVRTG